MGLVRKSRTYGDSHRDSDKKHINTETDRYSSRVIAKLIVESVRDRTTHPERKCHPQSAHRYRDSPIAHEVAEVHLQADQKQEQNEAEVGDEG